MKEYLENILHITRNVSKSISFIFIKKAPFIRVVFVEYLFSNFWKLIYSNMGCITYFDTITHPIHFCAPQSIGHNRFQINPNHYTNLFQMIHNQ